MTEIGRKDQIRELVITKGIHMARVPQRTHGGGCQADVPVEWEEADENSVLIFSAVGAFFAKSLTDNLGVKVGIIKFALGGTIILPF